jgi:hypothetical protein
MKRGIEVSVVSLLLVVGVTVPFVSKADSATPIKAGEHFLGLVNGTRKAPIVKTVCPGPVGATSTGRVAGRQTMSVVHVRKGGGYTGLFSSVYSWFQPVTGSARPIQMRFTSYATPRTIPNSIRVPCGGSGTVVFSSCPYLAPCAAGWVTNDVKVTFEDIAA